MTACSHAQSAAMPPVTASTAATSAAPASSAAPVSAGGPAPTLEGAIQALQGAILALQKAIESLSAALGAQSLGGGPASSSLPSGDAPTAPADTAPPAAGTSTGTSTTSAPPVPIVASSVDSASRAATGGGAPTDAPRSTPARTGGGGAVSSARDGILMIGDSLGVGTKQYLNQNLAGRPVTIDAKGGRTLAQGMKIYDSIKDKPRVVEMGLFTNDDPRNVDKLRAAVEKTIADAKARGGIVVWATIQRPPVGGVSYDAANNMLREMARTNPDVMRLVDWEADLKSHSGWLAGDKVHGTGAGYKARAQAFADAAKP